MRQMRPQKIVLLALVAVCVVGTPPASQSSTPFGSGVRSRETDSLLDGGRMAVLASVRTGQGLVDRGNTLPRGTARVFHVNGAQSERFSTLAEAVSAADQGDTIMLSDGVFRGPGNRDVVLVGKSLSIRTRNGPSQTIIDCESKGRAFDILGPLPPEGIVISGLSIVRGLAFRGGAVHCLAADNLSFENCWFLDCEAEEQGGGIFSNSPAGLGPAVSFRNCVLSGCRSSSNGGGANLKGALLEDCLVAGNESFQDGAGLYCQEDVYVGSSLIHSNRGVGPQSWGAGIYSAGSASWPTVVSLSTIADNCGKIGSGLAAGFCAFTEVSNTIVWGNLSSTGLGPQIYQSTCFGFGQMDLSYCCVEEGIDGIGAGSGAFYAINVLLGDDPGFSSPSLGDYTLSPGSPLQGAGDPNHVTSPNDSDLAGLPRQNGLVDLGAYEAWAPPTLSQARPNRPGWVNYVQLAGFRDGEFVHLFAGCNPGTTSLGFGVCPTLSVGIEDAGLLAVLIASQGGEVSYSQFVPISMAGQTVYLQAVGYFPSASSSPCITTNRVEVQYAMR